MIPSNGCFSVGRATREKRTRAGRTFCTTREGLLRRVRELCGPVDDEALTQLHALTEFHLEGEPSR
jgi:hypothetical protein